MKKSLKLLIVMLLFLVSVCGCNKKIKEEDKIKVNNEEKVIEDKEIEEGIIARETNIVTTEEGSELTTEIYNDTNEDKYIKYLDIIFKDENGNEVKKLIGYVGKKVKSKSSEYIVTGINIDLSNTKEIEYKINY